jgi:SecD/SecF fusion protein
LPQGLNIDFNGGTAYGGRTAQKIDIRELRKLLDDDTQKVRLQVAEVEELSMGGPRGYAYAITYRNPDGSTNRRNIQLPNPPAGATPEERTQNVRERAEILPDVSVEQIFPSGLRPEEENQGFFTIRTSEKAPELVQASISRLLGDHLKKTELVAEKDADGRGVVLSFVDPISKRPETASPSQIEMLLRRECESTDAPTSFTVERLGAEDASGRVEKMHVRWGEGGIEAAKLDRILAGMKQEFQERPIPDRLENFDSQLAAETQTRAFYAILASWLAVLLYVWFRFGNWTFGLAAVLCLVHDVLFTLGLIAFCHYIYVGVPWLADALLIRDFKIDLPTVAALLTLVGYSINDKIVVYDRMREVRGKKPELTPEIINDSINQSLSRTVLTGMCVLLVLLVLYIWGGEGVHLFAFVMLIGMIVGTYSSIYIASPLLLLFGEGRKRATVRERQAQPAGAER